MEQFKIIKPRDLLTPYIKHYWFLRVDSVCVEPQRIIPVGNIELVFHRGKRLFSLSNRNSQPAAFISGQFLDFEDLEHEGEVDMITVTFRPQSAKVFFYVPMTEFAGQKVDVRLLGDPELEELQKKIADQPEDMKCVEMIETFFLKRLNMEKAYHFESMALVVRRIERGETSLRTLADASCLSYKQFQRVFATYVGFNPKDFLRVVRYQRALFVLQHNRKIAMGQLAFDCNYYDESHLIKDFKKFSGYTPTEHLTVCDPYSDYFSEV